jgi:hypothetical protein
MTVPLQRTGPARPAAPPYAEDPTTATRHMCAGAYLDDDFRNLSLREVYHKPRRMVAPSYGFDLVPVLGHCLRARNAAVIRDAAIVVLLFGTLCFAGTALVGALAFLIYVQVLVSTVHLVRDTYLRMKTPEDAGNQNLIPRALFVLLGWVLVVASTIFYSGLFFGSLLSSFGDGGSAGAATATGVAVFGSLALTGVFFGCQLAYALWRQGELGKLTPGRPVVPPVSSPRLDEIARQQLGNTVAYSGYRPFVGSGFRRGTWSFAQRLVRPVPGDLAKLLNGGEPKHAAGTAPNEGEREFAEAPFDAQEIIEHVRGELTRLIPKQGVEAEQQIPGLSVEDRVFLAGTEVSHLVPYTDPQVMAAVVRYPTTPARHYLTAQVFAWGGELITTVYVHIAVQGRSLYIELTTTVLQPCSDEYRIVDTVENLGAGAWLRAIRTGITGAPQTVWRSPVSLFRGLIELSRSTSAGPVATTGLTRGYDYGATVGVRELACRVAGMRNLVQQLDVGKYQKLIERRVIASVLDFLDDKHIDTTEYRNRAASILNVQGSVGSIGSGNTFQAAISGTTTGGGQP